MKKQVYKCESSHIYGRRVDQIEIKGWQYTFPVVEGDINPEDKKLAIKLILEHANSESSPAEVSVRA